MQQKFTIKKSSELIREYGKWILVRKSLGLSSFGMNIVELAPGQTIPEHTEVKRDHEEVFYALRGTATVVIDGVDYEAPEGTFIRLDPEPQRFTRNDTKEPISVLIISAPRTSGYEPLDWA